jgi:membrane protein implicated in regulation of membrane protease activity
MLIVVGSLLLLAFHVVPEAWGLTVAAAALAFDIVEKGFWIRYTRRIPVAAGPEAMVGQRVTVISACRPAGRVKCGHESWKAYCVEGAAVGESLVIDNVENTTLVLKRPRTAR